MGMRVVSNMKGLEYIKKTREYCDYLERHLNNVGTSWKTLQKKCKDMSFVCDDWKWECIDGLVAEHDLSKFSAEEFMYYRAKFYPTAEEEEHGTAERKANFKEAWAHHVRHNPHHGQNWVPKNYWNPYEAEMHCVCMVIDWMAMGLEFGDTAESYYETNKDTIDLPDWAVVFIREIFARLRGE